MAGIGVAVGCVVAVGVGFEVLVDEPPVDPEEVVDVVDVVFAAVGVLVCTAVRVGLTYVRLYAFNVGLAVAVSAASKAPAICPPAVASSS